MSQGAHCHSARNLGYSYNRIVFASNASKRTVSAQRNGDIK
jgi:hypothetical protein